MKVEVKKLDKLKRVISIEVDEEALKKDQERLYNQLGKTIKVPGFRMGSAPLEVLKKHRRSYLREKFLEWAIPAYYAQVLKEQNIEPVSVPRIFDVELTDKKLVFFAELEVKPQLTLQDSDYKQIKIKTEKIEVREAEWEKWLESVKAAVHSQTGKDFSLDDLAKWVGYATVDELKEAIFIDLKSVKQKQRRHNIEKQIVETLLKKIRCDVPSKILADHYQKLIEQEIYALKLKGVSQEDIDKYRKDLEEKIKPLAKDQVQLYYILKAIAEREQLTVEDQAVYETVVSYLLSCAEFV